MKHINKRAKKATRGSLWKGMRGFQTREEVTQEAQVKTPASPLLEVRVLFHESSFRRRPTVTFK